MNGTLVPSEMISGRGVASDAGGERTESIDREEANPGVAY